MSRARWVAAAVVLAAVLAGMVVRSSAAAGAVPEPRQEQARAQERERAQDEPSLEMAIEASFGDWIGSSRSYPVFVTLSAEQRFEGRIRLAVNTADGPVTLQRAVDVGGGSSERYGFVAPPTVATGIHEFDVAVLDAGNRPVVEEHHTLIGSNDHEVVGMFPDIAARSTAPDGWVPLAVERSGIARVVPVAPDVLGLGPLALDPLDQLVTSAAELAELPEPQQAVVLSWVDAGGELLVVGDVTPVEGVLPTGWLPPPGGSARAGLGAVRAVGDSWQQNLVPSPTRSRAEEDALAETLQPESSIELPLARRARAHLSGAGGLGLLLVLYVLVLGPGLFLVTRMLRRRQLVWAAVPVFALGATGLVAVGGDGLSDDVGSVHVTVYETGPAGSRATTWSVLAATTADSAEATVAAQLPAGWVAGPLASEPFGEFVGTGEGGNVQLTTDADGSGPVATVSASAGVYGTVRAEGAVPDMADALVVEASSDADGQVVGTARNQLDVPLHHVVAVVGRTAVADLGTLAPGVERDFALDDVAAFGWGPPPEIDVLPRAPWDNGQDPDIPVARVEIVVEEAADGVVSVPAPAPPPVAAGSDESRGSGGSSSDSDSDRDGSDSGSDSDDAVLRGAWFGTLARSGWNYRPLGQVVVVGWTDQIDAPVIPGPGTAATRESVSAVVARASVVPAGERLTDSAVVRSYLRGPGEELFRLPGRDPDRPMDQNFAERDQDILGILYGFEVPATVAERPVDPTRLTLGMPGRFDAAEVWTPAGWVALPVPPHEDNRAQLAVPLPADALVGGRVFLRATVPLGSTESGQELVLYEREEGG